MLESFSLVSTRNAACWRGKRARVEARPDIKGTVPRVFSRSPWPVMCLAVLSVLRRIGMVQGLGALVRNW